ncbi:MAG: class I SAM-dependent methyltransferase [Deltaproteobacteria bacterium]|nr:class I SAM-dependent methyltransferase [Deltaproteobacteria bacterium]
METDIERWLKEDGELFLREIGIKKGQIVLDFGCGVGNYTIPAAKAVGKGGKVYAIDKDGGVLDNLRQKAESEGLKNIEPMKASGELKIGLKDESVDAVLLYDVLHYIDERRKIFDEAYRVLKAGALLSVYPKHLESEEDVIRKEVEEANFYLERKTLKKLLHDSSYNKGYILNFRKNEGAKK